MSEFEKEIEIKFKIDEKIASNIRGIKLETYDELDEYFFTKENVDGDTFLRFRKKNGKIFLNLKIIVVGGEKTKDTYEADEIETEITEEQYEEIKKIFKVIFPIFMQVKKTRSKGRFNDCDIFYDKVENIGDFLEIEGSKDKILEVCKKLNIDMKNRDEERGYAKMTLKKMGLI